MLLNGSVKTKVKCLQLLLSKFPEAVKATPASLECVVPACMFTLMFVGCHASAGLLHSPGSFRRAQYRWFIPPNLSCTAAGARLPSSPHEWGAISLHDHINNHLWLLSAHISLRWQLPLQRHLELVLCARILTSRSSHVGDPEAKSRTLMVPAATALISYSILHPPPSNVCCSNLAGNAWDECQMLFLLGIYEKLSDLSHWWLTV